MRGGAGRGKVRDRLELAKRLHIVFCRRPVSSVRYRQVSFVKSNGCFAWGEEMGRALAIQGAFKLIRTVRYIPAMATTDYSPPNRSFLFFSPGAVGRTLVIFSFIRIQHGMIRNVGCKNISNRNLMTTQQIPFSRMGSQK